MVNLQEIWKIFKNSLSKDVKKDFILIIILVFVSIGCLIIMNKCHEVFYNALVEKNARIAVIYLSLYTAAMTLLAITEAEIYYRKRLFTINSRNTLYKHYGINSLDEEISKFSCQRMSQDLLQFGSQFINLFTLMLHAILLVPSFFYILSGLINPLIIMGVVAISVIFSYISKRIGNPVTKLQYAQESMEGGLRRELIHELQKDKKSRSLPNIQALVENYINMSKIERWLIYFQKIYDRISHTIPYCILLPIYLAGTITLGAMVRIGGGMSKLITEVSFFIANIDKIVEFNATCQRIYELDKSHKD